jgi:hypothetical protein
MILTRPTYLHADTYAQWVHRNASLLARYWVACSDAIVASGGPAPALNDWEDFTASQHFSWLQGKVNDRLD